MPTSTPQPTTLKKDQIHSPHISFTFTSTYESIPGLRYLKRIPKSRMPMTQKMLRLQPQPIIPVPALALLILPTAIQHLRDDGDETEDQSAHAEGVA